MKYISLSVLLFSALVLNASTKSYILKDGFANYEGTADTMIIASESEKNFGGSNSFLVGSGRSVERRALLRFDLARLAGKKVESATLQLYQVNVSNFTTGTFEIGLFPIAAANANWQEGEGTGTPATAGESAWAFKAKGSPDVLWAGQPGLSSDSRDLASIDPIVLLYDAANNSKPVTVTVPAELVQQWIDNPASNGGLLLKRISKDASAMGGFRSSEHASQTVRPQLEVVVAD